MARSYGAEVPFLRPRSWPRTTRPTCRCSSTPWRGWSEREGYRPEVVVQLRPTSPSGRATASTRPSEFLLRASGGGLGARRGASGQNPYKMWRLDGATAPCSRCCRRSAEPYNMPRQKLPPTYWQTGHVDAIRAATIRPRAR